MLHGPTIWQESNSITKDLDGKNKTRPIDNEWSRVDQIDLIGTKNDVKSFDEKREREREVSNFFP